MVLYAADLYSIKSRFRYCILIVFVWSYDKQQFTVTKNKCNCICIALNNLTRHSLFIHTYFHKNNNITKQYMSFMVKFIYSSTGNCEFWVITSFTIICTFIVVFKFGHRKQPYAYELPFYPLKKMGSIVNALVVSLISSPLDIEL